MKIASWNINSLRVRLPQVLDWVESAQPDVLGLQEIKMQDDVFPEKELQGVGYHAVFAGQKTYNGVALLIKETLFENMSKDVLRNFPNDTDPQKRQIGIQIGDFYILNVYVPNGSAVGSEKYVYKLAWLKRLQDLLSELRKTHKHLLVMGDFNIAPKDIDVHDAEQWKGKILCSALEREALDAICQQDLHDSYREMNPDQQAFSWWDYRQAAFRRNLGLRIDLILANSELMECCIKADIDPTPRTWERPSDHTPVIAEFEV